MGDINGREDEFGHNTLPQWWIYCCCWDNHPNDEEEEEVDDVSSDQFNGGSGLFIRSLPGRVAVGGDNAV